MKKVPKIYIFQMIGLIALYIFVIFISTNLMNILRESPLLYWVALLPLIPIGLGLLVFIRFFGELDELQKQLQLKALAFSFGATALLTFSYGLLQNAGLPQVSFIAVLPSMTALWGLGYVFSAWRFE